MRISPGNPQGQSLQVLLGHHWGQGGMVKPWVEVAAERCPSTKHECRS